MYDLVRHFFAHVSALVVESAQMKEQIEIGRVNAEEFLNIGRIGSRESICFLVVRIAIYCTV